MKPNKNCNVLCALYSCPSKISLLWFMSKKTHIKKNVSGSCGKQATQQPIQDEAQTPSPGKNAFDECPVYPRIRKQESFGTAYKIS